MTTHEAIAAYFNEAPELALADAETIADAELELRADGHLGAAEEIASRWDAYQEDLSYLVAAARVEFGLTA